MAGVGRWLAAAVGVLVLLPRAALAQTATPAPRPAVEPPDAEMLLNLELLSETNLVRDRELYGRLRLLERLKLLERLRVLDSDAPLPSGSKEVK